MTSKHVEPQLGAKSFSCPHCGALAHQHWSRVLGLYYERDKRAGILKYEQVAMIDFDKEEDQHYRKRLIEFRDRLKKHVATARPLKRDEYCSWEMQNIALSQCYSCDGFAIWVEDRIVYPLKDTTIEAHDEMPGDIRHDFDEAASIVNKSPRGAAALLRLCIQKLMRELGEKGENINDDIASLVRKGLETEIQQALDVVRVTGNNAVHPGQIELKDDKATAMTLFELVNLIVERRIATPNRIKTMFENLPPPALQAIEKRDKGAK